LISRVKGTLNVGGCFLGCCGAGGAGGRVTYVQNIVSEHPRSEKSDHDRASENCTAARGPGRVALRV